MMVRGFAGDQVGAPMGMLLLFLAAGLWSTVGVASGLMPGEVEPGPMVTGMIRTGLGALVLLGVAMLLRMPMDRRARFPFGALMWFGLCCALFQIALFEGFERVGVSITVAVTVCLPPVILAVGESLWHGRWPDVAGIAAVLLAAGGVILLQGSGWAGSGLDPMGLGWLIVASVAFSVLTLASRVIVGRLNCVWATGCGLSVASAVLGLAVLATNPAGFDSLADMTGPGLAMLFYMGAAATGGAYLAFFVGLRLSPSGAAALTATMIEPMMAALLAVMLLQERLSGVQLIGCLCLGAAMVVRYLADRPRAAMRD